MNQRLIALLALAAVLPVASLSAAAAEEDVDIAGETAHQTLKTRLEFADKCGITPQQLLQVMRAKAHMARLQHQLTQQTEALAVTLGSTTISDQEKQDAVEQYLAIREASLAQYNAIQQEIVKGVEADSNPLALGALIVLGVVDSGRRVTCAVKSPVAGGAGMDVRGPLGADLRLEGSFGPGRAGRPAAPGSRLGPGLRNTPAAPLP